MKYAVHGDAGAGKDTLANFLATELEIETYAFAKPIKQLVHALFDTLESWTDSRENKERVMNYHVDPDSLRAAADVYYKIGLGELEDFPDAWEAWQHLLGLELSESTGTYIANVSLRQAYQLIGTEWGRSILDNIWQELAPDGVIISDVRFDSEAEFLRDRGYTIIEVIRPGLKKISESSHASEAGLLNTLVDIVVVNEGTVNDLRMKAIELIVNQTRSGIV